MVKKVELVEPIKKSQHTHRTLNLENIWRRTPDVYKQRATNYAKFKSLKRRVSKADGRTVILSVIYTTHDHNGNKKENPDLHYQQVIQLQPHKKIWNSKCKVSCSCLDFLFMDEVALFKSANTDIMFSNGELPVIKNPSMRKQYCKHLVKLVVTLKQRGW